VSEKKKAPPKGKGTQVPKPKGVTDYDDRSMKSDGRRNLTGGYRTK